MAPSTPFDVFDVNIALLELEPDGDSLRVEKLVRSQAANASAAADDAAWTVVAEYGSNSRDTDFSLTIDDVSAVRFVLASNQFAVSHGFALSYSARLLPTPVRELAPVEIFGIVFGIVAFLGLFIVALVLFSRWCARRCRIRWAPSDVVCVVQVGAQAARGRRGGAGGPRRARRVLE